MNRFEALPVRGLAVMILLASLLGGCETIGIAPIGKRIDYKSASAGPTLELPPDLTSPQFDDRYSVTSASELAAKNATRPAQTELLPVAGDARVGRAGSERWLIVKATPDQAWSTVRKFWLDNGFVIATEQPALGVMETDWAENRAEIPQDVVRKYIGKYADIFYSTYKRDKFRTRIERGVESGTVEIYVSHRGMEQMPTTKIDNAQPAGFAWAVMPPNPNLEAEMLSRLMVRFGTPEAQAVAAASPAAIAAAPVHARLEKGGDGLSRLVVDDPFDRAWRRVGLALDRTGFTVVDRDRSNGTYFVRFADPDADMARKDREKGFLSKVLNFWKTDEKEKPEQYRIRVVETAPQSTVSVLDPSGAPDRTQASDRILALLRDQLK
ncbi:MAG: outer membrane protein assembly factor BamC [Betaproteobacteria bacterium]